MSNDSQPFRILVVDDDLDLLAIMTAVLTEKGFSVVKAQDGAEAKYLVEKENFDLIICDIYMPLLNGLEFISMIRSESGTKQAQTPIVAISGHVSMDMRTKLEKAGVSTIYTKPVSYLELVDEVRKLLAQPA